MSTHQKAKELTGSLLERAARKKLRELGKERIAEDGNLKPDYNGADLEDIISEAWLEYHTTDLLKEELNKEGLEWTPENLQRAHELIDARLRDTKPSALGARLVAQRWRDELRSRAEDSSSSTVIEESEDGDKVLLEEALQSSTAVTSSEEAVNDCVPVKRRGGKVLNDRCTPQQAKEEQAYPVRFADREAMLLSVRGVLPTGDIEWLLRYYRSTAVKSGAERNKCFRLLQKAKVRLNP